MDMIRYDGNKFRNMSELTFVQRFEDGTADLAFKNNDGSETVVRVYLPDVEVIPASSVLNLDSEVCNEPKGVMYRAYVREIAWVDEDKMTDRERSFEFPKAKTMDIFAVGGDSNVCHLVGKELEKEYGRSVKSYVVFKCEAIGSERLV